MAAATSVALRPPVLTWTANLGACKALVQRATRCQGPSRRARIGQTPQEPPADRLRIGDQRKVVHGNAGAAHRRLAGTERSVQPDYLWLRHADRVLWYFAVETSHNGLTHEQRDRFRQDGYVVLERIFGRDECRQFVRHVDDLSTGRKQLPGFGQQENYGQRTFNQHLYDPLALRFLIDARLHRPLADCFGDEPEAIQTMHFYEGSEHPLHQDQYYLPDCMSAWIAMVDVDDNNGPLVVQPGSHRGRLVTKSDASHELRPGETYMDQQHGRYFPLVREVFRDNGREQAQVLVKQGDVVLFHGRLIHGGAPVRRPGTPRHALACHYIPYQSESWDRDWPRISFDGSRRVHYRDPGGRARS